MRETFSIGLTNQQRDLLLRGLQFVRRSIMLEMRDPSPQVDADRADQLQELADLVDRLEGAEAAGSPANV